MFDDVRFSNAVAAVVEGILKRENTKQVLHIATDFRINPDGDYETRNFAMGVEHLIFAPGRSVRVLTRCTKNFLGSVPLTITDEDAVTPWIIQSNHDSCWREDGFRIFGELANGLAAWSDPNDTRYKDHPLVDHIARLCLAQDHNWTKPKPMKLYIQDMDILPITKATKVYYDDYNNQRRALVDKYYLDQMLPE